MTGSSRSLKSHSSFIVAAMAVFLLFSMFQAPAGAASGTLLVMAGAASKPAIEEIAKNFEKETGVKVELNVSGSGVLLSQIKIAQKGDVYFPGSVDFICRALKEDLIIASTETKIVYLVPAINVRKGNPKNIRSLKDLCKPGIKVIIANPEVVCLGVFAAELAEKNFSAEEKAAFRKNIGNYVESCEKTANVISLDAADAVIGWSVFEKWDPERIETVKLAPAEVVRISYLSAAVTKFSKDPALAKKFIDYMNSPNGGLKVFKKLGYFATSREALEYLGADKPVGGNEYAVPLEWIFKK